MDILVAWLPLYVLLVGGIIHISMAGGFPSSRCCLHTFLMGQWSISCGLRVFFYIDPFSSLLIISRLPLFILSLHIWRDGCSQLWVVVAVHVEPLFTLVFLVRMCWAPNFLVFGFSSGEWPTSIISWWIPLSMSGITGTLFGLCPPFFPYLCFILIICWWRMGHINMEHIQFISLVDLHCLS